MRLQGFDPPDVGLVVLFGAPSNLLDFEQMAGRGGRDGRTNCLVLLLAEPWLFEAQGASSRPKALRTDNEVFDFVQSEDCLRAFLALENNDTAADGQLLILY